MTLNRTKVSHIAIPLSRSQISVCFATYNQPYASYNAFSGSHINGPPKSPITAQHSSYTIYLLLVSPNTKPQSILVLRPAIFELQAICRQVNRLKSKCPWKLQGQRRIIRILLVSLSPKCQPLCSTARCFQVTDHFDLKCTEWPQNGRQGQRLRHLRCVRTIGWSGPHLCFSLSLYGGSSADNWNF